MRRYPYTSSPAIDDPDWSPAATAQPEPAVTPQRMASIVALPLLLAWPPIVGAVFGLAAGWYYDDFAGYIKLGVILGLLAGCVLSGIWLVAMTGIVQNLFTPHDAAPITPQPLTINYAVPAPERIRIIPFHGGTTRLIDDVDERDLCAFIEGLPTRGHTLRPWLGYRMPSGKIVDQPVWYALSRVLRKAGVVQGVTKRKKGYLVMSDPLSIKAHLGIVDER